VSCEATWKKRENRIISLHCVKVFFAVLGGGNRVGAVCLKQKIAEKIVLCSEKDWLQWQCFLCVDFWFLLIIFLLKRGVWGLSVCAWSSYVSNAYNYVGVNIYFEKQKAYTAIQCWTWQKSFSSQLPSLVH